MHSIQTALYPMHSFWAQYAVALLGGYADVGASSVTGLRASRCRLAPRALLWFTDLSSSTFSFHSCREKSHSQWCWGRSLLPWISGRLQKAQGQGESFAAPLYTCSPLSSELLYSIFLIALSKVKASNQWVFSPFNMHFYLGVEKEV